MNRATRIIGHMVTRNEMGRYLAGTTRWLQEITDVQYVYDDRSIDGTFGFVQRAATPVGLRSQGDPSFEDDESAFRANAWRAMEMHHAPTPNDWILCVDADEFFVAPRPDATREALTDLVQRHHDAGAVTFPVHEVFGFDDDHTPLLRVDGYWGQIEACRLVRWRPHAEFAPRVQGGGSVPAGWAASAATDDVAIMHLGYARATDRTTKHARYSKTAGHNPRHVSSILEPPKLVRWEGMRMVWPKAKTRP